MTPSMIERFRLAWGVFNDGLPWSPWSNPVRASQNAYKRSPLAWPSFREDKPEWQIVDLTGYIAEGFNLNVLIYEAIMYKARAQTVAPLRAYTGDPKNPDRLPPNHPLSRLLMRPNPYQSGPEFHQLNTVYLNLAGEFFVHMDRPKRGGLPTAMRSLRPDRVFPVPGGGGLRGFIYVPEGRGVNDGFPMLIEDTMHVKLPNPGDPLEGWGRGLSPVSALARSADVDNHVTSFLKVFFEHGTMPSTVVTFDQPMEEGEMARARAKWMDRYGGFDNWGDVAILDNSGKIQRLGLTFEEMGFEALDERNETRVLGPFGVAPILVGSRAGLKHATYANYEEARRAFWQDTFVPELALSREEYQYYLSVDDVGGWPDYDLSDVPALRQDVPNLINAAHVMWTMGVPANHAFAAVGLKIAAVEGGDIAYVPVSAVPVLPDGSLARPEPEPAALPPGAPPPGDEGVGGSDEGVGSEDDTETEDGRKAVAITRVASRLPTTNGHSAQEAANELRPFGGTAVLERTDPKHLPGVHDQGSHGSGGSGGGSGSDDDGGSARGGGGAPRSFDSDADGRAFLKDTYSDWRGGLSAKEDAAMTFYQSPGYALMNGQLRGHTTDGSPKDLARARDATKHLKSAIAKAPPLARDTEVWRGFSADQFGTLAKGSTVSDSGFTSTALTREQAGSFQSRGAQGLAQIRLPKGTRAAAGTVKELVLPPGSSFRVLSVSKRGKITEVEMELVS